MSGFVQTPTSVSSPLAMPSRSQSPISHRTSSVPSRTVWQRRTMRIETVSGVSEQ